MVSLKRLPERARLREESEEIIREQQERESKASGFSIDGELSRQNPFKPSANRSRGVGATPANPFAAKKETAATSAPFNPFKQK